MFLTMFSTFAKSEISKYGDSWENAKGNIILTNCALKKIRIPIFVEHFLKPVQIKSLIESSVIVWRRRSAFQILIQKGHMLVYVPKIFDIFERIQYSSEISMPELFSKSTFWIWIIGSDCKLKLAQIPEKAQKSFLNNFLQKKTGNSFSDFPVLWMFWIFTSIYVGRESGKTKQFGKLIGWADLFLVCSDIHTESTSKKMICGFFLNLLECSHKATFLEQTGTKTRTMIFFRLLPAFIAEAV